MGVIEHSNRRILSPYANDRIHITRCINSFREGVSYTTAIASTNSRQTEQVTVNMPVLIKSIEWNVPAAETYTIRIVTGGSATTVVDTIVASQVTGGGGLTTFIPDAGDILLVPNTNYWFQLIATKDLLWRYKASSVPYNGTYINLLASWFGPSGPGKNICPIYFNGYPLDIRGTVRQLIAGFPAYSNG